MRSLEEEITVVDNICLLIKLLNETACCLHSRLLELIASLLGIKLTLLLVGIQYLEDIGTAITLHRGCVEAAGTGCCSS